MICLFEHAKLCLLGYYCCRWAVYPTFIKSVGFSRFCPKETCQNTAPFSEMVRFHNLKQKLKNTFPQVCVRGGKKGHTVTHDVHLEIVRLLAAFKVVPPSFLVRPNPKSFAVWRFLGRLGPAVSWMTLP